MGAMRIGFVGLGNIGGPCAGHLVAAGHDLVAADGEELIGQRQAGGRLARHPRTEEVDRHRQARRRRDVGDEPEVVERAPAERVGGVVLARLADREGAVDGPGDRAGGHFGQAFGKLHEAVRFHQGRKNPSPIPWKFAGDGFAALVKGHSAALTRLADDIAGDLARY